MSKGMKRRVISLLLIFWLFPAMACETAMDLLDEEESGDDNGSSVDRPEISPTQALPREISTSLLNDKWDLWSSGGTLLRGANIWQARVVFELDGPDFKGSGPIGPPYSQADFDRLAAYGANYITLSGPGVFTEEPPFEVDQEIVAYWDDVLDKVAQADLFATIAFRTGPGRSEFNLCCGGESYYDGYFNDTVWEEMGAQDAWVEMWRFTAERYRANPIIVGYKLMVEPNSEAVFYDVYEPEEFYPEHEGTILDWNQLYPRLVEAIRQVDPDTPILVGAAGYSAVRWLPYLKPIDQPHIVYVAHQYHPYEEYTHQSRGGRNNYPDRFDLDYDGEPDAFNRAWLDELLLPLDRFSASHGAPVSVDEFGVIRWVPGAASYMNDLMDLFERRGINYSLWEWQTSWPEFREEVHSFDFRLGSDPDNRSEVENELMNVILNYWRRNQIRPSNAAWLALGPD
jgi:hypothetical protein